MSLINKMLQDLDARGTAGADPMQDEIRPVAKRERRMPLPVALVSLASAVSLAAGGYAVVRYLQHRGDAPAKPAVAALPPAPVVNPRPAAPAATPAAPSTAAQAPASAATAAAAPPASNPAAPQIAAAPAAPVALAAPATQASAAEPAARGVKRTIIRPDAPLVVHPPAAKADGARGMEMARITGNAEGAYRRALDAVNEGRIHDGVAMLEEALRIDPRHEGARQTLVGLLVENNRTDEAMRHLQAGLAANPAQPSMAMLLARMQIERGASGVDTLLTTLPAAAGNAEYHAFLAGALQREGRFREAAEQYQAALRRAPQNGVWLMGLGISLQGDGRDTDALAVFQRAKAVGNLSPELQAFVERKIASLSR